MCAVRHPLEVEFELTAYEILNLVQQAPRLKQAVKGWVAEEHLGRYMKSLGLGFRAIEQDGQPDFEIFTSGGSVRLECKNLASQKPYANGDLKLDFQRTRNSPTAGPTSRFYKAHEFEILAACLHNQLGRWAFMFIRTSDLPQDKQYPDCLSKQVRVPHPDYGNWVPGTGGWVADIRQLLSST